MTGIVKVTVGSVVSLNSVGTYVVKKFDSPTKVVVVQMGTDTEVIVPISELKPWKSANVETPRPDLESISEEKFAEANKKYEAIKVLVEKGRTTKAEVLEVANAIGVSTSSVYRWIKNFKSGFLITNILRKERSDIGKSRLDSQVEQIVGQVISEYWLTPEKRSYALLHREIQRRCRVAKVPSPSLPTVVERANRVDPIEATKKRHGRSKADKLKLIQGTVPNVDRPYSVIQIDHTLVDIELVDSENRVSIGRPWITIAIDVYSRMVVGYYISFDPPGMLGTGICIANLMLPKGSWMSQLGVSYDYPCMGRPRVIHLDNAKEFHSHTLDRGCQEYGIDIHFRKVATPRYGGHIERLMGTFAKEIKALSGTTFSNYIQKGDYNSTQRAAFTLKKFEEWIAHMFLGVYHQSVHSSLGEPPLAKYKKAFLGTKDAPFPGLVEFVLDEQKLRLDFLPMFEGTIQPYGVKIDHITYTADVLRRWVGAKDPKAPSRKRKFLFRRDPRDISYIYFYDPDAKMHFKIPYRDRTHPAISLWELRAVRKFLVLQGRAAVDESTLFRAYEAMRKIEEQEQKETARVRRSDAMKRAIRRKESPQPKPLTKPKAIMQDLQANELPILPANATGTHDGFDEIERY